MQMKLSPDLSRVGGLLEREIGGARNSYSEVRKKVVRRMSEMVRMMGGDAAEDDGMRFGM